MLRRFTILLIFLLLPAFSLNAATEKGNGSVVKKAEAKKTSKGTKGTKGKKGKKKTSKTSKKARSKGKKMVVPLPPAPPGISLVSEVRHWSTPDYTRVAVTLDHEATFEKHEIANAPGSNVPSRIYFDINGAKLAPGVRDIPIGDGLLKTARIAQYKTDTVRVVLDVENIREYKIFTFSEPYRIIVDVKGERLAEIGALNPTLIAAAPLVETPRIEPVKTVSPEIAKAPQIPKPVAKSPVKPGKIRRIVVDPGHGGKDPGAVGPTGLQEKDVVLSTGLLLAARLKEELGIDAVLTRSTDVFIELQERTAIANQVGADLFISIHANAALNRSASGIETYYLNLAKTEKAAQLAARENGTSLEKVSLLQAVLFDLMANYKLNDSAHLSDEVQKALHKRISGRYQGVKNLGVKQGPFYVLVGATMPSILVETAFISNEKEESRLRELQYHEQAAQGILEGVISYISALK